MRLLDLMDMSAGGPHIAVFVQDFPPEAGAGPARITEMAAEWLQRGARVSVITGMPSRRLPGQRDGTIPAAYRGKLFMRETLNGIEVYRSWLYASPGRGVMRTALNNASFALTGALHAWRSGLRPDVVLASGPPYLALLTAALWAAHAHIPLVVELRDLWPDYLAEMRTLPAPMTRGLFASERWLLRRAAAVSVVTESFRQRVVAKGIPADRIGVFPNGVDLDFYRPSTPASVASSSELVLGYLGTFGAGQGLGAVIAAIRTLRADRQPVRVVLTGDGSEREVIERAAGGDTGITFTNPIARDATPAFYASCDAVLVPHAALPMLASTVPSKLFEIMACGRPVIAALAGEGARIVRESGAGLVANPGDAASIAGTIREFLALTSDRRAEMGRAGRAFVETNCDRRVVAERLLELLTEVAASTRSTSKQR